MILANLTRAIREQNYYAVVLEFLIVIVGVFMGIQLGNWNDERADRAAEAQYLVRLTEDMQLTKARLQTDLDWQVENAARLQLVLQSLRRCGIADEDKDSFALGLFNAGKLNTPLLVDTTLEELKSSGRMNIISNEALRHGLVDLQRRFRVSASQINTMERWLVYPVNEINLRTVYLNLDEESGVQQDIEWNDVDFDFVTACQDTVFRGAISASRNYTLENARRDRALLSATQELLSQIEASR